MAQRSAGDGAEATLTGVQPDAIGRGEIVAHVDVWRAVAVEIAHHYGQSPVVWGRAQRAPVFVQKRAIGEREGRKTAMPVVAIQSVGLAVLHDLAALASREAANQIWLRHRTALILQDHRAARLIVDAEAGVWFVTHGHTAIISNVNIESAIAIDIGQR